ncbi:membrane protein [Bacillus subtilis]|nr:membrane protein [Bacillus subtilis]
MLKRFCLVFLTLIMSIAVVLAAAKDSPGDNVISFDQPIILMISIGIIVFLFIPPLAMSFFGNWVVRIISGVYQCFIVLTFLGLIPIGFLIPNGFLTILVSIAGTLISIASVVVTLFIDRNKEVTS